MYKKILISMALLSLLVLPSGLDHTTKRGHAASSVLLGIYPNDSIGTHNYEITILEDYLGENRVSVAGAFLDFEENPSYITSELNAAWDNGYWPLLNIGAGNVPNSSCTNDKCTAERIANGELDAAITNWAQLFKDWTDGGTKKAYLAPLQEMNGNWVDYYGDPANYKLAFERIVDIFMNDVGVDPDSVEWVFAPNGWSASGDPGFEDYYPGDHLVDAVGFSSFNWGTCFTGTTWETYDGIYKPYLDRMAAMTDKPIWILEMASHTEGGDRAAWFNEALTKVANYPGVEGVMYFNRAEDPHNPNLLEKCNEGTSSNPSIDYSLDHNGGEGKATFKTEVLDSRYGFSVPTTPEMDVKGGGQSIADGDSSPSSADDTDFGNVNVDSGSVAHTFTIQNTGTANLFLTGSIKVEITGDHAADFSVTAEPDDWLVELSGGTETFEITFDPSASGVRTAEVTIANDDGDENPYTFSIQGTGTTGITKPPVADFDGDGDTDLSVFKVEPWGGMWYLKDQGAFSWGNSESIPVPGDYDGDGTIDAAVYNDGTWYIKDQFVDTWGDADSVPVPGDYDGDGETDLAVYKIEPWGGMWYIKDQPAYSYGNSESIPVPGDYDGDGTTDVAVYNDGTWYIMDQFVDTWGDADSIPVPGNYDGDEDDDLAVFKVEPWGGMWYIKDQPAYSYGNSESIPVPGDYDGDGTTDVAVYNDGTWYIMNQFVDTWGDSLSFPLVAPDTNGDGDPYQ